MNVEKEEGLYTDYGQKLRGKVVDVPELIERLQAMSGSTAAQQAADTLRRFMRLLNPVWMGMLQEAMANEQGHPDEARIFNFMGSGGSDFTFVAEFRALMGDERVTAKEGYAEYERAVSNGEIEVNGAVS